jgi:hypothetical protein
VAQLLVDAAVIWQWIAGNPIGAVAEREMETAQ